MQTNVSPVLTIKRTSDNRYFTGSTWSTTETTLPMTRNFQALYTYNFTVPAVDNYICFAWESVNKVSGAVILEATDKIEYLDATISSRANINPDNTGIANINSKLTTDRANLLDNLDMKISDIPTSEEVWNYATRTLSPASMSGIGIVDVTVNILSGISVEVYTSTKQEHRKAISNGSCLFGLNPGDYYLICEGEGYWPQQIKITVPNQVAYSVNVTMQEIEDTEELGIKFRELPHKDLYANDTIKVGIEAFSLSGKAFTIDSSTYKIGSGSATAALIEGRKVYATANPSASGTIVIEYTVVVNSETFKYKITKKVL